MGAIPLNGVELDVPDKNEFEAAEYLGRLRRQALAVLAWFGWYMEEGDMGGIRMLEVRVASPSKTGSDYRVTAKGVDESGKPYVAFANGADFQSAMLALKNVYETRGITWRDDKPWVPKGPSGGTE